MSTKNEVLETAADRPECDDGQRSVGSNVTDDMPWVNKGQGKWSRIGIDDIITEPEASGVIASDTHDHGNHGIGRTNLAGERNKTVPKTQKRPAHIIVGLYIGATTSGYAFCYKIDRQWSHIQMNQSWANEYGINTTTVPTAISCDSSGMYEFGNKAINAITHCSQKKKCFLKEVNQLRFRKSESEQTCSEVQEFLSIVLTNLRNNMVEQLRKYNLRLEHDVRDIQWIVTKASVMKHDLPQAFLEQIIKSQNIQTLPEDEAAAIWCAEIPIYELTDRKNPSMMIGDSFGMVDFESGFLSLYKKKAVMSVEQLATQSLQFDILADYEKLFCEVFEMENEKKIKDYKIDHPIDWLIMIKKMQTQIDGFKYDQETPIYVTLEYTFVGYFKSVPMFASKSVSLTNDKKLVIKPEYFRGIFDMYAKQILFYLNGLNTSGQYPISYLFLIGKTKLLAEPMKSFMREQTFPNVKIKHIQVPEDSRACALRGAVLKGRALASKQKTR